MHPGVNSAECWPSQFEFFAQRMTKHRAFSRTLPLVLKVSDFELLAFSLQALLPLPLVSNASNVVKLEEFSVWKGSDIEVCITPM